MNGYMGEWINFNNDDDDDDDGHNNNSERGLIGTENLVYLRPLIGCMGGGDWWVVTVGVTPTAEEEEGLCCQHLSYANYFNGPNYPTGVIIGNLCASFPLPSTRPVEHTVA